MADDIGRALEQDLTDLDRRIRANAGAAAELIQGELRGALSVPYPPASKPGGIPHKRSGALQAGAYAKVVRGGGDDVVIEVGDDAPHAAAVARARPFIEPTLDRIADQIEATLFKDI